MIRYIFRDFSRAFYAPVSHYREIRDGRTSPSWVCVLVYCLVYVAGALWLYFNGFTPFVKTWIVLDPEIYYLAESFYLTPVIFIVWVLGAGLVHVTGRLFGGTGRFDIMLRMTGYSLWVPWYPLIIVDSIHRTPEWLYNTVLGICIAGVLGGTAIAVKTEENIGVFGAILTSVAALVPVGLIMFTYIR